MSYEKITDRKYVMRIDGNLVDINVPFGKASALFECFVGQGGVFDSEGNVQNELMTMVRQFSKVGDCLLSEYGPKGAIVTQGDCSQLSVAETITLFQLANEIVEDFIVSISPKQNLPEEVSLEEVKGKAKKTKE